MNGCRIERIVEGTKIVLKVSGHISVEQIPELKREIAAGGDVLDLKEVTLVSGDVIKFLGGCESKQVQLRHCPQYIREWIQKSRRGPGPRNVPGKDGLGAT